MAINSKSAPRPDVIVIGAGIIGSSIALRLARAGLRVTVFDRGRAGAEASSAAAGMIAPQGEKAGPPAFTELCWMSHGLYPEFVAEVEELSGQQVGYRRDGSVLVALDELQARELEEIEADQESGAKPGGTPPGAHPAFGVERLTAESLRRRMPGLADKILGALFLAGDHWVDNERLSAAVVEAARRVGVTFHENTAVGRLKVRMGRVEAVEVASGQQSAGEVVLAAGCWSGELAAQAGVEIPGAPCLGQMIELEIDAPLPAVVRAGHHYLVPRVGDRVIVGTTAEYAGFEKRVTATGLASILQGALRLAPLLAEGRFRRAWAGLRPDTEDHLPVLGRSEIAGLTLASGHFRNGILLAPVTARLIADLVLTGSVPAALGPFGVGRFARAARTG